MVQQPPLPQRSFFQLSTFFQLTKNARLDTVTDTIIDCAVAYSRLNACVRVNGGHFEHKF